LQQFALEKNITKSIKKMTQAEKVALRYEFIMSKTANSQGDFARTSGGAANQMRMFSQGLKELGSQFGELILPFFTKLVLKANNLIKSLKNLNPEIVQMGFVVAGLAAALPPLLIVIGSFVTVIGAIVAPVGLVVAALGLLVLKFNEISNVVNDFTLTLKMVFQLAISKSIEKVKLLMNNLGRLGAIMKELITKRFSSDLDSINEKYDEQADKIRENAKEQQDLIKKFAELRKETNDLPPTIDVLLGKLEQLTKKFFKTKGAASVAVKPLKDLNNIFGNGMNFSFDVLKDSLKTSTTWKGLTDDISESTKTLAEIEAKRAKLLEDRLNVALGVGSSMTNVLIDSFNNLNSGGDFFQPIINGLKALITRLIAAATAAAVLSALLPSFLGGKQNAFKTAFSALSGIPKFANGGIVSSPTLGLMGEYPGARSNPEVIAPLDKLKSMIGGGQTNVNITGGFKLEGQDLVLALQRADRNRTRIL